MAGEFREKRRRAEERGRREEELKRGGRRVDCFDDFVQTYLERGNGGGDVNTIYSL